MVPCMGLVCISHPTHQLQFPTLDFRQCLEAPNGERMTPMLRWTHLPSGYWHYVRWQKYRRLVSIAKTIFGLHLRTESLQSDCCSSSPKEPCPVTPLHQSISWSKDCLRDHLIRSRIHRNLQYQERG